MTAPTPDDPWAQWYDDHAWETNVDTHKVTFEADTAQWQQFDQRQRDAQAYAQIVLDTMRPPDPEDR